MHFRVISGFSPAALWVLLVGAALASTIAVLEAGGRCVRELHSLRAAADPSHATQISVALSSRGKAISHEGPEGTTIAARPFDELARFSARIAHEQRIDVVQLQSERVNTAPAHLRQERIRLRVRGDYAGTKAFLISLLTNFPGLALEHLTIRHTATVSGAGPSTPAPQGGDDDSTIELIQYSMPVQAGA
jgi:hypothetical protein